ncbi:hypothetical protein CEW46_21180 [Bacillus cereus]|nr:hypothetical protein CEW46_21180 [Bacillus cereus]
MDHLFNRAYIGKRIKLVDKYRVLPNLTLCEGTVLEINDIRMDRLYVKPVTFGLSRDLIISRKKANQNPSPMIRIDKEIKSQYHVRVELVRKEEILV